MLYKRKDLKVEKGIIEDLVETNNGLRELSKRELGAFIRILDEITPVEEEFSAQFKFSIFYEGGVKEEIETKGKQVRIDGKLYDVSQYASLGEYPFVKLASYHEKLNYRFQLLEMKLNNPTRKWMNSFVLVNDGYLWSLEGLNKSDEAFNGFIVKLFDDVDKGLSKEKAYTYVKELYEFFNKLNANGLISIYTDEREDICVFVDKVLESMGLLDEKLTAKSSDWMNW